MAGRQRLSGPAHRNNAETIPIYGAGVADATSGPSRGASPRRGPVLRDRNRLDDDAAREFLEQLDYQEAAIVSRLGNRL